MVGTGCAIWVAGSILIVGLSWLLNSLLKWYSGGRSHLPISEDRILAFGLCCAVLVVVAIALYIPRWIEIGDRLRYRTFLLTRSHEWSNVYSMQFRLDILFYDPSGEDEFGEDPDPHYRVYTNFVVTLANRKRISMKNVVCHLYYDGWPYVGSDNEWNENLVYHLAPTLVTGLKGDDAGVRLRAAQALGTLEPDNVLGLDQKPAKGCEEDFLNTATRAKRLAVQSKDELRDAALYLKDAANDTNADVRKSAAHALCRIESRGI